MFNRFTIKAQEALQNAQDLAASRNQGELKPIHLLFALSAQEGGVVGNILNRIGVNVSGFLSFLEMEINRLPKLFVMNANLGQLYLSPDLVKILDRAAKEASSFKDEFISCEHLFLAILETATDLKLVFEKFNIKREPVLKILKEFRGSQRVTDEMPENKFQVLEKYSINLTQRAREKKLDPVIGREDELHRIIQIISRRTKNNPILIGEPGVGKTAIVEGLAQKIISGDIPESLKDKEIISLDLAGMVAGTKFRGEFEDRLKAFIQEIQNTAGKLILFIDEIHMIVGAGAAEGAIDASNLLKPPLARGDLHAVGATTVREYQRHIEKDPALERRFQPIMVEEPSVEDAVSILRGLKEKYEMHHGLRISDKALISAVNLSARYIPERFLPDKAIDLIDEAASARRLETESLPAEIDKMRREITRLEIERSALLKENNTKNKTRLKAIEVELNELKEKNDDLSAGWHAEKIAFENLHGFRKKIEDLRRQAELAEREGYLEKVARIIYGELPQTEKDFNAFEKRHFSKSQKSAKNAGKINNKKTEQNFIKEAVDEKDIAAVVARWTGIPVSNMLESEAEKLSQIEEVLGKRVVGQKEGVEAVANALRRGRAGLADENKPLSSFMFLGPTGVGKTELAKTLAKFMFNDEKNMVRIDMSEYMERHAVSRLIGSPPGYIGHEEGGQLTEIVRHRPYSLILFDEIEKAHPEVFNILLQILDNGRLTDGKGKTVNFRNSIIIMTSNVGSHYFKKLSNIGFSGNKLENDFEDTESNFREKVLEELKDNFKPEFLNRIDEIIVFNALKPAEIEQIVDIQLNKVREKLVDKNIKISFDASTKKYIAEHGFDPDYGARPINRLIQKMILDKLADKIIRQQIKDGAKVKVSFTESAVNITV